MTPKQFLITLGLMLTLLYSTSWHYLPVLFEATQARDLESWWRDSTVYGDAEAYLQLAHGIDAGPPYKYRILPILAVQATGLPPELGFIVVNAVSFVLTGLLMTAYLLRCWQFNFPLALFGGVLAVTTVSLQSTMLLPMVDAASYPFGVLIAWSLHRRNPVIFAVICSMAVATKEVYVAAVPIFLLLWTGDRYEVAIWLRSRLRAGPHLRADPDRQRRRRV